MRTIGGYFEFETITCALKYHYHNNLIAVNSGRNALEYILRAKKVKKIYIPYYTCDAILEPLVKLGIKYNYYYIDQQFSPIKDFDNNDCLLYVNYFGVLNDKVHTLSKQFNKLIVDNSQAFYARPGKGLPTFYSPRKFFGVPDGGFVYCYSSLDLSLERDVSYSRCSHLLIRADTNAENGYADFQRNDDLLKNQPIKRMSKLTDKLLRCIDYKRAKDLRNENFVYLHRHLGSLNELTGIFDLDNLDGPMVYPFLYKGNTDLRKRLHANKIYTAQYWPNLLKWLADKNCFEYHLYENLIPLPIDQRYGALEMERICKLVSQNI
jgi:hypothetical protein